MEIRNIVQELVDYKSCRFIIICYARVRTGKSPRAIRILSLKMMHLDRIIVHIVSGVMAQTLDSRSTIPNLTLLPCFDLDARSRGPWPSTGRISTNFIPKLDHRRLVSKSRCDRLIEHEVIRLCWFSKISLVKMPSHGGKSSGHDWGEDPHFSFLPSTVTLDSLYLSLSCTRIRAQLSRSYRDDLMAEFQIAMMF